MLDSQSFVVGFIIGFLFALFIGNFAGRIRKNRAASTKSGKKVSVAVSGSDSPREIVGKAAGAGARMTIWFLIVVAISVLTIYGLFRVWSLSPAPSYSPLTGQRDRFRTTVCSETAIGHPESAVGWVAALRILP